METIIEQYDGIQQNVPLIALLVFIVLLIVVLNVVSMLKTYRTHQQLGGRIQTYGDLDVIKEAINLNMILAIAVIISNLVIVVVLIYGYFLKGLNLHFIIGFFFFYGMIHFPLGFFGLKVENLLRTLIVESNDQCIEQIYQRYIQQWKEARIQLPD